MKKIIIIPILLFATIAFAADLIGTKVLTKSVDIIGDASVTPVPGHGVIRYNPSTNKFEISENGGGFVDIGSGGTSTAGGTVTSVTSGGTYSPDLTISSPTANPVIQINSGTTANKLVRLDSSSRLPAVDGSLLTNLSLNQFPSLPTTLAGWGITDGQPLNSNLTQFSSIVPANCNGKYGTWIGGVYTCGTINVAYPGAGIPNSTGSAWGTSYVPKTSIINTGAPSEIPTTSAVYDFSAANFLALAGNIGFGGMTGELLTAASTTTRAGIRLPHGTAPNSPQDGQCWTTTAGLYCRINSATVGPYGTASVAVGGGILSYLSPTITLNAINLATQTTGSITKAQTDSTIQSRVTGSATTGYAITAINADGTVEVGSTGGSPTFDLIGSGERSGTTDTIGAGASIKAGGGQIQATELVCTGGTCTYTATHEEAALTADRTITYPDRSFTLDQLTTSTTSTMDGPVCSDGTHLYACTFGANMTFVGGQIDSTGGAGTFAVTTSTQTTDTTLTAGNFGSTGINPLRVGDARYKLPSAAANLYRPITSRGTATIWPASSSDVITLNGTALSAGNQITCTKGPLWVTGFAANDWSIDGVNCSDGSQPTLTSNPTPTLDFGSVSSATTSSVGFTNTAGVLATLGTPTLSGTDKARFTLNNACSSTLASSATCSIGVTFDATVGGPYAASLDYPYYNKSISVALSGTGVSGSCGTQDSSISTSTYLSLGDITSDTTAAYSFTAATSYTLKTLYVSFRKAGSPTGTVTLSICDNSSGSPGSCTDFDATVTASGVPATCGAIGGYSKVNLAAGYSITSGNRYWIKMVNSITDSSNYVRYCGLDGSGTDATKTYSSGWVSRDASWQGSFQTSSCVE